MPPQMLAASLYVLLNLTSGLDAFSQDCVLKVGAWESFPEVKHEGGGTSRLRKATLTLFKAAAVNQTTQKRFESVYLLGNAYFEDLPKGMYKVIVTKPGFRTTIQSYAFECTGEENGFDFLDVLLIGGSQEQVYERGRVFTVRGDRPTAGAPPPLPTTISGGVLNVKAINLPKPPYPAAARAERASGPVSVQVLIDQKGKVISATAVSGHTLLRPAAVAAARSATFSPTFVNGRLVKVSGVITYNFIP